MLDAFGYRPAPVARRPRSSTAPRADYIREKVVFSTTPHFRVPAYVLIPKGLHGRAPAIVDLHSHGGMFLFGKEKVIDFGRNHPAMTDVPRAATTTAGRRPPRWSGAATSSSRSTRSCSASAA